MDININAVIAAILELKYNQDNTLFIETDKLKYVMNGLLSVLRDDFKYINVSSEEMISFNNYIVNEDMIFPRETDDNTFSEILIYYKNICKENDTYDLIFQFGIIESILKIYDKRFKKQKGSDKDEKGRILILNNKKC